MIANLLFWHWAFRTQSTRSTFSIESLEIEHPSFPRWTLDDLQQQQTKEVLYQEDVGSNPTVYWMDVRDASCYYIFIEKKKNKGSQMVYTKKLIFYDKRSSQSSRSLGGREVEDWSLKTFKGLELLKMIVLGKVRMLSTGV